jgi:hypothetical protein
VIHFDIPVTPTQVLGSAGPRKPSDFSGHLGYFSGA